MGEIADMMINGECCQECGQFFDEETGYPATCEECGGEHKLNAAYYEDEEGGQQ